jgi:SagB-type dehydrogenase family enzyme
MDQVKRLRENLKSTFQEERSTKSDQQQGLPPPSLEKPPTGQQIELPKWDSASLLNCDLKSLIKSRQSRREYGPDPLSLEQLSWLLWATQGVHGIFRGGVATRRTVPSAGSRHAFETYICILNVTGLKQGLYRYLAIENKLELIKESDQLAMPLVEGCLNQAFAGKAAATFIWTAIPYRSEWRYPMSAHKILLLDAGHVCQNMYLAAEAIGFGTCAIAAYDQAAMDKFVGADGEDEFTVYIAPVGKII